MNSMQNSMGDLLSKLVGNLPDFDNELALFIDKAMAMPHPYYVVSCPCDCLRLNCAKALRSGGSVSVVPVVNNSREWVAGWKEYH